MNVYEETVPQLTPAQAEAVKKRRALLGVIFTPIWSSVIGSWWHFGAAIETLPYAIVGSVVGCALVYWSVRRPIAEYVAAEIIARRPKP